MEHFKHIPLPPSNFLFPLHVYRRVFLHKLIFLSEYGSIGFQQNVFIQPVRLKPLEICTVFGYRCGGCEDGFQLEDEDKLPRNVR